MKRVCSLHQTAPELLAVLGQTQTLLALIANDPTDPGNGHRASERFNCNKAVIAKAHGVEP